MVGAAADFLRYFWQYFMTDSSLLLRYLIVLPAASSMLPIWVKAAVLGVRVEFWRWRTCACWPTFSMWFFIVETP